MPSPVNHRAAHNEQLENQIQLEETRLLYGGTPFAFIASAIMAMVLHQVLYDHVDSNYLLDLWTISLYLILALRTFDTWLFTRSNTKEQEKKKWRIRFLLGAGVAGLTWGLLPWMAFSNQNGYFDFTIIVLVGIIAGSLSSLSYRWEAIAMFMVPATGLLMLRFLIDNRELSNELSFAMALFILFSFSAGKRIFKNMQQNIRLRLEADSRERAIELMHQKQFLHLQQTPLAAIEFDINFKISEWNPAAEVIFGYSAEEAIGSNIMHLILTRENEDEVETLWNSLLKLQPIHGAALENKTRNGQRIFCEWFITPLTHGNNELVGIAAMALDITEKKHNELALIESKNEAEKANQAKSDFLSNMSHELRTPLNAILGFTQLLKYEKNLSEKQQSHINEISNAGSLLLELVNQILDLARIEKGYLELSMEAVSLRHILVDCDAMIQPLAQQYDVRLDINTELQGYVQADYTRLKQVMLNLLTNAIKYNIKNGLVRIRVENQTPGTIRLIVEDTGKGIDAHLMKVIFQPFNRLNAASNIEGTGIGLSISKQLTEMMGGSINAKSTPGKGSQFWIDIQGKLDQQAPPHKIHETPPEYLAVTSSSTSENIHILIAEDNPTNQTLIFNQLKMLGYHAELAHNGQEALQMINNGQYDLLLTDCNMPLMDGYELARNIRNSGNQTLPIIALTADAFPEKKDLSLQAGMNDHLTKPVTLEALQAILHQHLVTTPKLPKSVNDSVPNT